MSDGQFDRVKILVYIFKTGGFEKFVGFKRIISDGRERKVALKK